MKGRFRLGLVLSILALTIACAHPRHTAVVADTALYEVLNDVHQGEQVALCGKPSCAGAAAAPTVPGWTLEKSRAFNQKLLPAVEAGRQFNQALANWKAGQTMPDNIRQIIAALSAALQAVTADFPDGGTKSLILANIGKAQAIVLSALDIVLAAKGA